MYRVTTPVHTYTLPMDTSTCTEVMVTYKQGSKTLTKNYEDSTMPSGMSFDGNDVIVKLTQTETKAFRGNSTVSAQVRVLTIGGDAYASQVFIIRTMDVLNEEVLE